MKWSHFLVLVFLWQFCFVHGLIAAPKDPGVDDVAQLATDTLSTATIDLEDLASSPTDLGASGTASLGTSTSEIPTEYPEADTESETGPNSEMVPDEYSDEGEYSSDESDSSNEIVTDSPSEEEPAEDEEAAPSNEIVTQGPSEKGNWESGEGSRVKSFGEKYKLSHSPPIPFSHKDVGKIKNHFDVWGKAIAAGGASLTAYLHPDQDQSILQSKWDHIRAENLLHCYLPPNVAWIDEFRADHTAVIIYQGSHWAVQVKKYPGVSSSSGPKYFKDEPSDDDDDIKIVIYDFINLTETKPSKRMK